MVAFVAELADHRLDVSEGPISRIDTALVLLNGFHLNLDLIAGLSSKFLHVATYELNLGVQIVVPLLSVLVPFLKLQVSDLKLIHDTLVLLLSLLEESILVGQLAQLLRKLRELAFKFLQAERIEISVAVRGVW